jgi:WD40 repeat protein
MNHKTVRAGLAGAILLTAAVGIELYLWSTPREPEDIVSRTLRGHRYRVAALAFSPDGKTLVSAGGVLADVGEVHVWDVTRGHERLVLPVQADSVEAVAFAPDGKSFATASNERTVTIWETATGQVRHLFQENEEGVSALGFAHEGRTLVAAGYGKVVWCWDLETGRKREFHQGCRGPKAISPDGRVVATGKGSDRSVILCDLVTGQKRSCAPRHKSMILSVTFSPDGKTLASLDQKGQVIVWDVATGQVRWALERRLEVTAAAFSPDGEILATGSRDRTVKLWELATGRERAALEGHEATVGSVAFAPGGKMLASGGYDKTVHLWEVG